MTDKELNRAILCELVKIADGVFEKTNIKAGTYTAAELQKEKDANGNTINYVIEKELTNKSYEVCVEGFKCSFLACQVFNLVWRFEQLAGVKSSEKKRFVRMSEAKKDVLCYFYVNIEKSHTTLCKLVAADELRPVMTQNILGCQKRLFSCE